MKLLSVDFGQEYRKIALFWGVIQFFLLFLLMHLSNPLWSFIALILIVIIPVAIYSPGNLLIILLLYISIFPNESWGSKHEAFVHYVNWYLVLAMLIGIALVFYIRSLFEQRWRISFHFLDKVIIIFLTYVFLNAAWGFYQNGKLGTVLYEFFFISLYTVYFFARLLFTNKKWIKFFLGVLIVSSTSAAIQLIYMTYAILDVKSILLARVVTQQPHLAQISLPLLFGMILFGEKISHKILGGLVLLPNFLMVVFSQQRALYVGIVFSLVVMVFFYYFRAGFSFPRLLKFFLGAIGVLILILIFLVITQKYFNLNFFLTVADRLATLSDVNVDESWRVRFTEVSLALEKWRNHIFIGSGLGATYPNILSYRGNTGVDNSYAFVLWKLGIWGIIFFVMIYVTFLIQGLKSFWVSKTRFEMTVTAGCLAGISGMMIVAITNSSLILYRFNMWWAILIAVVQYYYLRNVKGKNV
jgi:hypothetical protein